MSLSSSMHGCLLQLVLWLPGPNRFPPVYQVAKREIGRHELHQTHFFLEEQPSPTVNNTTKTTIRGFHHSSRYFLSSELYVFFLPLNTQIHRQQSLVNAGRTRRETLRLLGNAVDALRQADVILVKMAEDLGWIRAGVLTYATQDNNIMMKGTRRSVDIDSKRFPFRNV